MPDRHPQFNDHRFDQVERWTATLVLLITSVLILGALAVAGYSFLTDMFSQITAVLEEQYG